MDLESVRAFVKVAELGSFTRAAEHLRLPKSSVSRSVARLEEDLGETLLFRSTRSVRLTAAGELYFTRCMPAVAALEEAAEAVRTRAGEVEGLVRLTAPEDLGVIVVNKAVEELTRLYPRLSFEVRYTDQVVNLMQEGFDVAVRIGRLPPSGLKSRRVGGVRSIFVASHEYLRRNPPVRHPGDLEAHRALVFLGGDPSGRPRWRVSDGTQEATVVPRAVLSANHARGLLDLCLAGRGVSFLPSFVCAEALAAGTLVRVLPAWTDALVPVHIVFPAERSAPLKLRVVLDHLLARIRPMMSR